MRRLGPLGLIAIAALAAAASPVCAGWDEEAFTNKRFASYTISTPPKGARPTETVIGSVQAYRIRKGDTLIDLARYFDLGYNEITEANPGIDPWVPPAGAYIMLPTEWVLPCCSYEGVVVNIPEMRLFYYRRDGATTIVRTYPVGLGREDWQTPSGKFRITGKTVNPQWNIPESIRKEHVADRGDDRTFIPGGAPDNPLGKYRLELSLPMYRIHGTNIPWGVGMQVSHGCVRLYPEDIEHLFPQVAVKTPGEFTYQLVKAGQRGGVVYIESHRDIYGQSPALYREATEALTRTGLADRVDQERLLSALEDGTSMPIAVSPEAAPTARAASASNTTQAGSADAAALAGIDRDGVSPSDHLQARDD
jgi:L,D-transpeptidase ErfK/SrfK